MNGSVDSNDLSPTLVSHEIVGIGSLLFVLIILITLFSSKLIELFKFHHINESTISIMFGIIIGGIITFFPSSSADLFSFDSEFFFFVLLPPIVFEAGFSLKRKHFFRNMCSILIFAVLGTVISTLIIAFGLYLLSIVQILPLFNSGNPLECLLFGALISAVDPVGTLSTLGNPALNIDPTLHSLIFGESVLNDAVSIVLYKIFNKYQNEQITLDFESHFLVIIGEFCGIFVGSFFIGLVIALCASVILKYGLHLLFVDTNNKCNASDTNIELQISKSKPKIMHNNLANIVNEMSIDIDHSDSENEVEVSPENITDLNVNNRSIIYLNEYRHNETQFGESAPLEFSIIILFAYLSYNLGEVLALSGIVSVFSCGICMSHYTWYNLSWITQLSLHHIIRALSKCCENFVYAYLGISTVLSIVQSTHSTKYAWNISLVLCTLVLCVISRAANIFPLSAVSNMKRRIKISFKMQIMMFFSGLRGAIAFALALNIRTPHSDLIVTTTLSVVIVTTVLCGCTTKYMVDVLGLGNNQTNERNGNDEYYELHTNKNKKCVKDGDCNETVESPTFTFPLEQSSTSIAADQQYHGFHKHWRRFDRDYMQTLFGGSRNPYIQHNNIGIYSNRQQLDE